MTSFSNASLLIHRAGALLLGSLLLALSVAALAPPANARNKTVADVALVLAVDSSSSVSKAEYELQMTGLAQAFLSRDVIDTIKQCVHGRIAVMVIEWASAHTQRVVVPWSIVSDTASAGDLASAITSAPRMTSGKTSISAALEFATFQLLNSPVKANRMVIDLSGDGVNNNGEPSTGARDQAVAAGITVNGLAILNEVKNLDTYFKEYVTGGRNHFVIVANDYSAYAFAIKQKLIREISCLPIS